MFFPADEGDNYNLWRIKAYLQHVDLFFIKQIFQASVANMCSVQFLPDLSNFS